MKTGILIDRRYLNHDMGSHHVENPRRIETILDMIEEKVTFPFLKIEARSAEADEVLWIHTPGYFETIRGTADKERVVLDPDTSTSPRSFETALLAVGGILKSLDHIMIRDIPSAFTPVRPPGHHAEADRAMGFCLFNNIAVGAEHLIRRHKLKNILIVDWDLHHGNGTQNAFYARSDVLYFSTHQFPHYPGTGHWSEVGTGGGEGFTINIPLLPGKKDEDYKFVFETILRPIASAFRPDFILVSAGFDVAAADPLGGMRISPQGFAAMTRCLKELAAEFSQNRLLIALEGGYDLAALRSGSLEVLRQLSGTASKPDIAAAASQSLQAELKPMLKRFKSFWTGIG